MKIYNGDDRMTEFKRCDGQISFNIIDGIDDIDYDAILQDYQNLELSVQEIKEKHGIKKGKWRSITKQWKQNGITLRGRQNQKKRKYPKNYIGAKYYSYNKKRDTYSVYKQINGKTHYFGSYKTEEEAIDRVHELRESNWQGLLK